MSTLKFNVFTDNFDITPNFIEYARKASGIFDCSETLQIGDLVRASTTQQDLVEVITSNVYQGLVLGVVIRKPTSTKCEVLILGKAEAVATDFVFGDVVWVGTDGSLTTTKPATGHLQKMGIALTTTDMILIPAMEKVVQT